MVLFNVVAVVLLAVQLEAGLIGRMNDLNVHYDVEDNTHMLKVTHAKDHYVVASGWYSHFMNYTGWNQYEIWTNQSSDDVTQAYWGGYLEGYLSYENMNLHWHNTFKSFCKGREDVCDKINDFVVANRIWVRSQINQYKDTDPFWHQVQLFYVQLDGLFQGYIDNVKNIFAPISYNDLLLMNMAGDLFDLVSKFSSSGKSKQEPSVGESHCSAIVKLLSDRSDLYVAHNSWFKYSSMIRVLKRYHLNYHTLPKGDLVPGSIITFSSYPGIIQSFDDFYNTNQKLVVTETSISNYNSALWDYVQPENTVLESVRIMVANRLAKSGQTWSQVFSKYNSGTYNNQWMIIDYKKFTPKKKLSKGALWVLEQLPGTIVDADQTDILNSDMYWSSYNIPFYEKIFDSANYPEQVEKYGQWFSYSNAPRSKIFKRDQGKVKNWDTLFELIRSNNYLHDEYSVCDECEPKYSASNAIAARHDLNDASGTYPFSALGHRCGGATDAKMVNSSLIKSQDFFAVNGPSRGTNGALPAFKWSESDCGDTDPHLGLPDDMSFDPVKTHWLSE